jgi:hypothetical protein
MKCLEVYQLHGNFHRYFVINIYGGAKIREKSPAIFAVTLLPYLG